MRPIHSANAGNWLERCRAAIITCSNSIGYDQFGRLRKPLSRVGCWDGTRTARIHTNPQRHLFLSSAPRYCCLSLSFLRSFTHCVMYSTISTVVHSFVSYSSIRTLKCSQVRRIQPHTSSATAKGPQTGADQSNSLWGVFGHGAHPGRNFS